MSEHRESYGDRVRREHPWLWRWTMFRDRIERVCDWVLDRPYWTEDMTELRGLRTGRRVEPTPVEIDDDYD